MADTTSGDTEIELRFYKITFDNIRGNEKAILDIWFDIWIVF